MDMIQAYLNDLADPEEPGHTKPASPDTIKLRRKILTKANRELPHGLAYANGAELDAWVERQRNPNTRATYYVALVRGYAFWCRPSDPWLASNPADAMARRTFLPGEPRPASEEHLRTILERGEDPYRLWIVLAAYEGLRACEIAGLDREHVTAETLIVVRGKGGSPRSHDTDPLVWSLVQPLPPGPLARKPGGGRATAGEVSKRANYHLREVLGIEGVTLHMWRHRLGVQMQRLYRNIRVTQKALGHKSLTSTQRYTDASLDELREARAMLPRPSGAAAGRADAVVTGAAAGRSAGAGSRG